MIDSFKGQHRFLSNFFPVPIRLGGAVYPSVEHAYQAAKVEPEDEMNRSRIALCATAGQAKRFGRRVPLRPDWEDIKLEVMRACVEQKFKNGRLAHLLLSTGEQQLVEGNTWGDRFWGVCDGQGENHLGRILMETRAKLAARQL